MKMFDIFLFFMGFLSLFGNICLICILITDINLMKDKSELEQVKIKYYVNLLAYFTCLFFTCLTICYFINL